MDYKTEDGYLSGSNYEFGYIAIVNEANLVCKDSIIEGQSVKTVIYPERFKISKNRRIIHKNSSNKCGYDTTSAEDAWHLVQFSQNGGLFKTKGEAESAVQRRLDYLNSYNAKANVPLLTKDDLDVEIKKIRFECSMKFVEE